MQLAECNFQLPVEHLSIFRTWMYDISWTLTRSTYVCNLWPLEPGQVNHGPYTLRQGAGVKVAGRSRAGSTHEFPTSQVQSYKKLSLPAAVGLDRVHTRQSRSEGDYTKADCVISWPPSNAQMS
jgi:hypothetical protein